MSSKIHSVLEQMCTMNLSYFHYIRNLVIVNMNQEEEKLSQIF